MIALNQNYFDINYFTSSNQNISFFDDIIHYFNMLKKFYSLYKFLQSSISNIDNFLLLLGADSLDKIDEVLIRLEEFSDLSNEIITKDKSLHKWYNYPIRFMLNRVETSNMSLQGMLGSQQALIMHKNKNANR
ncbi:MAG: hypothetical protein QM493_04955 [Sulfurovum sp.]